MTAAKRLFYLSYVAILMRTEPGSKPKEARQKVERFVGELDKIEEEIASIRQTYPELYASLAKLDKRPDPYPSKSGPSLPRPSKATRSGRRRRPAPPPRRRFRRAIF